MESLKRAEQILDFKYSFYFVTSGTSSETDRRGKRQRRDELWTGKSWSGMRIQQSTAQWGASENCREILEMLTVNIRAALRMLLY